MSHERAFKNRGPEVSKRNRALAPGELFCMALYTGEDVTHA
jgi:hypothetical protein